MLKHCIKSVIFLLCLALISSSSSGFAQQSTAGNLSPAVMSDGTLRRIRVPVLMYHYVSELPADADTVRRDLTLNPVTFRAHLAYMAANGYTTISLYQLYSALLQGTPLPPKPVILTFDDGYQDHYTNVYPALVEYGMTGTFFLITSRLDAEDRRYVSWEQAAEMQAAGMSMEPHTKTHAELDGRAYDFLVYEILGSQQSIQGHLGTVPRMFSYPVGRYDVAALEVARSAEIWLAVTTQPGALHTSTSPLELPRVRIHGSTSAAGLAALLQQSS